LYHTELLTPMLTAYDIIEKHILKVYRNLRNYFRNIAIFPTISTIQVEL